MHYTRAYISRQRERVREREREREKENEREREVFDRSKVTCESECRSNQHHHRTRKQMWHPALIEERVSFAELGLAVVAWPCAVAVREEQTLQSRCDVVSSMGKIHPHA